MTEQTRMTVIATLKGAIQRTENSLEFYLEQKERGVYYMKPEEVNAQIERDIKYLEEYNSALKEVESL